MNAHQLAFRSVCPQSGARCAPPPRFSRDAFRSFLPTPRPHFGLSPRVYRLPPPPAERDPPCWPPRLLSPFVAIDSSFANRDCIIRNSFCVLAVRGILRRTGSPNVMGSSNLPATQSVGLPVTKTWFGSNWKWFVPILAAAALVCLAAFIFFVFTIVHTMFAHSYPYQLALQRAEASAEVSQRLGTPLRVGWFVTGEINYRNDDGDVAIRIPISGPKARGVIVVEGKKLSGRWRFDTLEVEVDGQDNPIPLQSGRGPPSITNSASHTI